LDRFKRGFVSGIIAGVPSHLINWGAYYFNFSSVRWIDFMGSMTFGHKPSTLAETLAATIIQYIYVGILGIVFAYLITKVNSKDYFLKATIFSLVVWFMSFMATQLFKLPEFRTITLNSTISNFIGAVIWGISLGYLLNMFDDRLKG